MTLVEIRPPEDVPALLTKVAVRPEGFDRAGVWRHRRKDGSIIEVEITTHGLRFAGRPAELVLVRDVTEQRRAERVFWLQAERLKAQYAIAQSILAAESREAIAHSALQHLRALIPFLRASVTSFEPASDQARVLAVCTEVASPVGPGALVPATVFGSRDELRAGRVRVVTDLSQLPQGPALEQLRAEGIASWIHVPLLAQGELIGTLNFGLALGSEFGTDELAIVREAATHVAIALQQAGLRQELEQHTAVLEQRVATRTAELRDANAELEAFAYSVSHDLRAPLRSIDGFSQALLEDFGVSLAPEGRRYLERVRAATQRMGLLIDDLLALSRVTRSELQHEAVDLARLARRILDEAQSREPARKLDVQIASELGALGDRRLLEVALENLLSNALKFTRGRAPARIELGRLGADASGPYFVRDNGAGFDMAYVHKLFAPFQRLHAQEEFDGSGIGLAIVRRVIQRHGGRVWAEAELGKGATFWFTLGNTRALEGS